MSESMVAAARERLGPDADIRCADLLELELDEPVDAILSTATFHWIADHDLLFRRLHAALRPGGRLVAQCGGEGNITQLRGRAGVVLAREPYATHFQRLAGAVELREHRRDARRGCERPGSHPPSAGSRPRRPSPSTRASSSPRSSSVRIVQHLPEDLREPFMDDVMAELGEPVVVDYVRLNIDATA